MKIGTMIIKITIPAFFRQCHGKSAIDMRHSGSGAITWQAVKQLHAPLAQ